MDPSLRLRLRLRAPEGYFASFPTGQPMDDILTVGEVVASEAMDFEVGDRVVHSLGWRSHALVDAGVEAMNGEGALRLLDVDEFEEQGYLSRSSGTWGRSARWV